MLNIKKNELIEELKNLQSRIDYDKWELERLKDWISKEGESQHGILYWLTGFSGEEPDGRNHEFRCYDKSVNLKIVNLFVEELNERIIELEKERKKIIEKLYKTL